MNAISQDSSGFYGGGAGRRDTPYRSSPLSGPLSSLRDPVVVVDHVQSDQGLRACHN